MVAKTQVKVEDKGENEKQRGEEVRTMAVGISVVKIAWG